MKFKWLAVIAAIALIGCNKDTLAPKATIINDLPAPVTAAAPIPLILKIDQTQHLYAIPPGFEGLSFETGILAENPEFLNENNAVLIQLFKNLGRGLLRIGGNSSDEMDWSQTTRTVETPVNVLTTTDIDNLTAFSKASGWPVLFGLNLGNNDASAAAKEALYVNNSLQNNLVAFQIGNEPDVFNLKLRAPTYNYNNFQTEWSNYFTLIRSAVPSARFAGPDVDPFNAGWISSFANNEHNNIRAIDGHYYSTGPASSAAITYHDILTPNPKLDGYLVQLGKLSAQYRFPYRISECNSVFGGGKPGVSDVFASALWALDFMWDVAQNKGQGINFHSGPPRFAYSPITMDNGEVVARPEYYAMLAFRAGSMGGNIIPATIVDPRISNNCSAYACANPDNSYSITLINKEDAKSFSFTVELTNKASTIQVDRLTAPSITSKTGTTYAGSTVNTDGTFTPAVAVKHTINSKNFVVTVPAGSAAVVTVR